MIVGAGPLNDELKALSEKLGIINRVKFIGQVTPSDLPNYTAGADAGLLLMEDVALNNRLALPQKLFQYLVAGIPQIVSPMPEIAGFVEAEQTGLIIEPSQKDEAAEKIKSLMNDSERLNRIKKHCLDVAERHNWDMESRILEIFTAAWRTFRD